MDKKLKAALVLRMERTMRKINNESIFTTWLSLGVADGDIDDDTTVHDVINLGYTDNDTFYDILDIYTKLVDRAIVSGGFIA